MRDGRRAPFCWQSVDALAAIRRRFDGRDEPDGGALKLNTALAIYVTLTEIANEQRAREAEFIVGQAEIAVRAGVTRARAVRYMRALVEAEVLHCEGTTSHGAKTENRYSLEEPARCSKGTTRCAPRAQHEVPLEHNSNSRTFSQESVGAKAPTLTRTGARLRIAGKPVNETHWKLTEAILIEYARATGRKAPTLAGNGQPSEHAKRVYGRVREHPDLTLAQHADIIARTLASRWWWRGRASGEPPTVGVVYGPRVFADNIDRAPTPSGAGRESLMMRHEPVSA